MFQKLLRSRTFKVAAVLCMVAAILLPAMVASAGYNKDYPLESGRMIQSIGSAFGTTCANYPDLGVTALSKSRPNDKVIIDTARSIFSNPSKNLKAAEVAAWGGITYDGGPAYKMVDGKKFYMSDMWVFHIDYKNAAGAIITDPHGMKDANPFTTNYFDLTLGSAASAYDFNKLSIFYLDIAWAKDESGNQIVGTVNDEPGAFFRDYSLGDYWEIDKAELCLSFNDQWPSWYALAYFNDTNPPPPDPTASPVAAGTTPPPAGPTPTLAPGATPAPTTAESAVPGASTSPNASLSPNASTSPNASASPDASMTPETAPVGPVVLFEDEDSGVALLDNGFEYPVAATKLLVEAEEDEDALAAIEALLDADKLINFTALKVSLLDKNNKAVEVTLEDGQKNWLSFPMPEGYVNAKVYMLIDDALVDVDFEIDGDTILVESDAFGTFVLADMIPEATPVPSAAPTASPTADNTPSQPSSLAWLWWTLGIVVVLGGGAAAFFFLKKK